MSKYLTLHAVVSMIKLIHFKMFPENKFFRRYYSEIFLTFDNKIERELTLQDWYNGRKIRVVWIKTAAKRIFNIDPMEI